MSFLFPDPPQGKLPADEMLMFGESLRANSDSGAKMHPKPEPLDWFNGDDDMVNGSDNMFFRK